MEVPAAETTVEFSRYVTNTALVPTTITIEVSGTVGGDANSVEFTLSVNGAGEQQTLNAGSQFTTEFTFPATTLSLSFSARQTAFRFTGAVSTEITLPSEHTHVTVNGVETAVDLPGLVTTIEVTDSTNIIIDLPEATTELEFAAETYTFTMEAYTISTGDTNSGQDDGSSYCGTQTTDSATGSACVMGITTTITLPTGTEGSNLYLVADGLTTAFTLPGITTTFKQSLQLERVILEKVMSV